MHVPGQSRQECRAHPAMERPIAIRPTMTAIFRSMISSSRTAWSSLARMCDPAGGRHWISRVRADRTQPYFYSFVTARMGSVVDGKIDREERARDAAQEKRRKRFEVAALQPRDVANDTAFEVANNTVSKLHPCNPNTYVRTTLEEHLPITGADAGEGTYTRESIPIEEVDFTIWIRRNIPDPTHHREALRLLRERKMTPEILRRMAA